MSIAFPFLPVDRLHALARGDELPDRVSGAALLADVWGFTVLADALAAAFGPHRGAEELTRHLNLVYGALIGAVDRYGGSVLGFSGDAITCWFDAGEGGASDRIVEAARRAATCGLAMQDAVRAFARIEVAGGGGEAVSIAPKVAVAAGAARRFRVGDGEIQYFDALAGATLDRLAVTERRAARGEVLIEHETALSLGDAIAVREWRTGTGARDGESAVVDRMTRPAPPSPWPPLPASAVSGAQLRPWLLSAVYERLLTGQGEFLAELRPAVAVFVRFGGIDYDTDERAGEKLDRYTRWVQGVLARFGGALIDLTFGDKGSYFYAAFGAPTAHEDDADRALHAALALRALPGELAFIEPVQIGISRGRTRAGPIGGPSRRAYTVTGNEVNVAARLMQAAAPGEILLSAHVLDGTRDTFASRRLPPLAIKGRAEPVQAVALEGAKERASKETGERASMVGRERELALVTEKMVLAARGSGQLLTITAEAGVGKSRLLMAVVRAAKERGFAVHTGEAQSFGTIATYLAWHGVWRGVLGVDGAAAPDAQRAALELALARIDPTLVPRLPLLGPVVGIAIPDNDLTRQFEAKLRKDSLEALLATCLRASSSHGPTLIAIEDAHWMDPLSVDLLESIGRAIAGMSVLLVVTSRPYDTEAKATARLAPLPHFTALPLGELTRADSATLITRVVRARLGEDAPVGERFIELLHARAEGNPFLAEELVEFLLDRGISPAQAVGLEATELPANLASAILGRIDRLTTTQQTTLRIASVIGRSYRFAWLWGVHPELGVPARVREDLDALAKRDLTSLESAEADETYVFKHSMVQEVVYGSLPFATRAKLHEQLAEWLEERGVGSEASVDLLAFHFGRSKNVEKQREYFRKAGDAAAGRYANEAAAEYYERLVEVVSREEQPEVLLSLGGARAHVSRWEDAEKAYRRALDLIEKDPPHGLRARVRMAMAATHTQRAAYDEALRWLGEAADDFSSLGDRDGHASTRVEIANTYRLKGKVEQALEVLEGLADEGDETRRARTYHVRGLAIADKPDLAGAAEWWKKSLELRRRLGDKPGVATMLINIAVGAFFLRRLEEARALLAEGQLLCRELGMRWGNTRANHLLALILASQGDPKAARALFLENYVPLRDLGALRELAELMISMILTWRVGNQPEASLYVLRLGGAGARLFGELGSPIPTFLQSHVDRSQAEIRAELGAETTERAWEEGRLMAWPQAVEYALNEA